MSPSGVVTLLSDFGLKDPFVGVMKGVILRSFPGAQLVDLTHTIAEQDVLGAAFWLAKAAPWFAAGTVHLAVVDPGVGSDRAPVVVRAGEQLFVGPDNGLFDLVRQRAPADAARLIDVGALGLATPSHTFHGRDVFAPVAARLASGALGFEQVGPSVTLQEKLDFPAAQSGSGRTRGVVVVIDRFGNLITNIEPGVLLPSSARVRVGEASIPCALTYTDVGPDELVAYTGSFGHVEIARRNGSAAERLGASRGTPVILEGP